jgi:hypothetical protein
LQNDAKRVIRPVSKSKSRKLKACHPASLQGLPPRTVPYPSGTLSSWSWNALSTCSRKLCTTRPFISGRSPPPPSPPPTQRRIHATLNCRPKKQCHDGPVMVKLVETVCNKRKLQRCPIKLEGEGGGLFASESWNFSQIHALPLSEGRCPQMSANFATYVSLLGWSKVS